MGWDDSTAERRFVSTSPISGVRNELSALLRSTLDVVEHEVTVLDEQGCILYANQRFQSRIKCSSNELGMTLLAARYSDVCSALFGNDPVVVDNAVRGISEVLSGAAEECKVEYTCMVGEVQKAFRMRGQRLADHQPLRVVVIHEDTSALRNLEGRFAHLASHDVLTGLPNRGLFLDRLRQAMALAQRSNTHVAVILFDLDKFKEINDALGHDLGDELVVRLSQRLMECLRRSDTLARMGGDEFAVLLTETQGPAGAATVADRILGAFAEPFLIDGHELSIQSSMGISVCPEDGEGPESLVKNADIAMYRAKAAGGNRYEFFAPFMSTIVYERLQLRERFHKGLAAGEFKVYYQPQVNIETGTIMGAEALIRWISSDLGMIMPNKFIPLSEDTGFIIELGEWILRDACMQRQAWQQAGLPSIRLAVNLSARQFDAPDLVNSVDRILAETGLPPSDLELEITESTAMQDPNRTLTALKAFRERGISVALDDFGTGYSSLTYLQKFPINTLKIGQAFTRDITRNSDYAAIVKAVLTLADSLRLETVVVEGVETEEQLELLRQLRCKIIQGFYFSRPVPAADFAKLLTKSFAR